MSERADIAKRILEFCEEHDINFFGEREPRLQGRYYSFLIGKPRTLDGLVRVYGKNFILIELQGPLAPHGSYQAPYDSEDKVIDFLTALCVDYDREAALAIPVKKKES